MWNDLRLGLIQALIQTERGFAAYSISRNVVGGFGMSELMPCYKAVDAISSGKNAPSLGE